MKNELDTVIQNSPQDFVIDFDGIEFIDSYGIGVIVAAHVSLKKSGYELKVINVANDIYQLFKTMRLDHHINIERLLSYP